MSEPAAVPAPAIGEVPGGILIGGNDGTAPRPAPPAAPPVPAAPQPRFTEEDLNRVREQEKNKLYPQLEELRSTVDEMKREREERLAEERRRQAEAEEAAKKKAEEETDVRSLLEQREREFNERLEAERREREQAFALLEREREFAALNDYRMQAIESARDDIIPDLIDLVSGNTPDEIEASIAGLRERSARILEATQQAAIAQRQSMVGARVTAPANGPLETNSGNQTFTPEQIAQMPMNEYVQHRAKLLGQASSSRNRGLFD